MVYYANIMDGVNALRYVLTKNIDGCIVECGVDSGEFEYVWIKELLRQNRYRDIFMYDTFNGLTRPGIYDSTCENSTLYKMTSNQVLREWESRQVNETTNSWCYTPLENVKSRLESTGYSKDKLHYVVGDVLETLQNPSNIPEKIAILRLDTDWYESSKIELEMLYTKVVSGGVIIFDDYFHWDGQRRATDEFFLEQNIRPIITPIGNGKTGYMIKE